MSTDARAIPLLAVPALVVYLAYRAYLMERQRHERLEFLYEATRTLSRSPEMVLALEGLLERSLESFRAEMAEIVLFGSEGNPPLRTTLGPGDYKEVMEPMDPEVAGELRDAGGRRPPGAAHRAALRLRAAAALPRRAPGDGRDGRHAARARTA